MKSAFRDIVRKVLSDGLWHGLDKIHQATQHLVSPEMAVRRYHWDGKTGLPDLAAKVLWGKRRCTEVKMANYVLSGAVERQGRRCDGRYRIRKRTMNIAIADIQIGDRHRKDLGSVADLAKSIADIGLLHPVVVDGNNVLVAGRRRLAACEVLKWKTVPTVTATNIDDALMHLKAERDENTCRKDFLPSEAVCLGSALEVWERKEAAKRQVEGGKSGGKTAGKGRPKRDRLSVKKSNPKARHKNKTAAKVGAAVGMSASTYRKAKAVVQAAESDPDKYAALKESMDATGKVDGAFKQLNPGKTKTDKCVACRARIADLESALADAKRENAELKRKLGMSDAA